MRNSIRAFGLGVIAASLALTSAHAQITKKKSVKPVLTLPGKIINLDSGKVEEERTPEVVDENTEYEPEWAIDPDSNQTLYPWSAEAQCYNIFQTRFSYILECTNANLDQDRLGDARGMYLVFRRDGTAPDWALDGDDFAEIRDLVMETPTGNDPIEVYGRRTFYLVSTRYNQPGWRYCSRAGALGDRGEVDPLCYEISSFGAAVPKRGMSR